MLPSSPAGWGRCSRQRGHADDRGGGNFPVLAESLGRPAFGPSPAEQGSLVFRRSLYVTKSLKRGDTLSTENLRAIRPGLGLPPKHLDALLGKRVKRDVSPGTPASWDLVE